MAITHANDQAIVREVAQGKPWAVATTFYSTNDLLEAIRAVRKKGYRKLDAFTPFPIHGIDDAMGESRSKLGYLIAACGCTGIVAAQLLMYWTGAVDYPLIIGGKPLYALEFTIPITFELMVLFSAFAAVFGMLAFNGLPRFNHPVFNYSNYHRATDDGFILLVERDGNHFEPAAIIELLNELGGENTEIVHEDA
jgi:hypothetical protein